MNIDSNIITMSELIKEYFELSNNLKKNKNIHINSLEKEINATVLNKSKLHKICSLIKIDSSSEYENLSLFSENIHNILYDIKKIYEKIKQNLLNISKLKELNYKYESEISKIVKINQNMKNKIDDLQNKISEKSSQIKILQTSIKNVCPNENISLLDSINLLLNEEIEDNQIKPWRNFNKSINRILDNYKIENEQLKLKQKNFEEQLKEMKNEKMNVESQFNLFREYYNKLNEEKKLLNSQIAAKDIKLIGMELEIEKYKKEKEKLNNSMISSLILEDNDGIMEIKEKFINLKKELTKEKEEKKEIKEEKEKLKYENNKMKKKLLELGIKYDLGGEEINVSKNEIIKEYDDKIENLEQKIKTYKEALDICSSQLFNSNNEKKFEEKIELLIKEKNELQTKYFDLETKYKNEKEKKIVNSINSISINNINNSTEFLKLKEENEMLKNQIKKQNPSFSIIEIKKSNMSNKSQTDNNQYYQEEFNQNTMAKKAWRKNKSLDLEIDYPGIKVIKEKYEFLSLNYNNIVDLVRKLLNNIQVNNKNISYVEELRQKLYLNSKNINKIIGK